MRTVVIQPRFEEWRDRARELLARGVPPGEVLWSDQAEEGSLFNPSAPATPTRPAPKVPPAFLDLARSVAAHGDPRRWGVLYRVLWRLTEGGEKHLLAVATDSNVRQLQQWQKAVGRDIHKMHAFVRFRLVGTDETTGREQFVAWFEPEHRIVRLAAGFFERRFAGMDWSILTPYECAHWDGRTLHFTPGVPRSAAPDQDALDDLWRTYYRSIFNPARLKVSAMQSEMPKKYWKNLPEASLISELISESTGRVEKMLGTPALPPKPAPRNAYLESLRELNATEPPSTSDPT
jgi:probable DNA metabolism protein